MQAAAELGDSVTTLVLLKPNLFELLAHDGRDNAYAEACAFSDHAQRHGAAGDWSLVAERFADYWLGDGIWA
jgi:hypothetical protein